MKEETPQERVKRKTKVYCRLARIHGAGHVIELLLEVIEDYKRKYGLSKTDAIRIMGKTCAACGVEFSRTGKTRRNCDHCHKSLKVRGFICTRCNSVLGLCEDNETIIASIARYLKAGRTA